MEKYICFLCKNKFESDADEVYCPDCGQYIEKTVSPLELKIDTSSRNEQSKKNVDINRKPIAILIGAGLIITLLLFGSLGGNQPTTIFTINTDTPEITTQQVSQIPTSTIYHTYTKTVSVSLTSPITQTLTRTSTVTSTYTPGITSTKTPTITPSSTSTKVPTATQRYLRNGQCQPTNKNKFKINVFNKSDEYVQVWVADWDNPDLYHACEVWPNDRTDLFVRPVYYSNLFILCPNGKEYNIESGIDFRPNHGYKYYDLTIGSNICE